MGATWRHSPAAVIVTSAGRATAPSAAGARRARSDGLLDHLHPVGLDRARTGRLLPRPAHADLRRRGSASAVRARRIYALQHPHIGRLGLIGALGYAYSYVAFTATVVYSFVEHTPDWVALTQRLGTWFLVHGAIMVVAGLCFGLAVVRAGVLPRWTAFTLMAGVCLVAVTVKSMPYGSAADRQPLSRPAPAARSGSSSARGPSPTG